MRIRPDENYAIVHELRCHLPYNYTVIELIEVARLLRAWGERLRNARIEKNDSMKIFGTRIGASEGTVRAMERGAGTVQVVTWLNALAALDRLEDVDGVLEPRESLIDRARKLGARKPRARAYARKSRS